MAAGRPALRLCASRFGAHLWASAAFGSLDAQPRHMAKQPHSVFSNSHLAFIRQLYMRQMQQPLAITDAMNRKYQTTFTVEQVRRCINNRGWSARRKLMVEKLDEVEKVRDAQITKKIAEAHGRVMEDVAKGAVVGMQKAVTFLEHADNPRTLQAGAAALKSLTTTWRLMRGIDNSTTRAAGSTVFSFNFASAQFRPVAEAARPVEIVAEVPADPSPASDSDDSSDE